MAKSKDIIIKSETYPDNKKKNWGVGEWTTEQDEIFWIDSKTNYFCAIRRNSLGGLCGYVGVPTNYFKDDSNITEISYTFDVHGGITFTSTEDITKQNPFFISPDILKDLKDKHKINLSNQFVFFGFDCAHLGDKLPYTSPLPTSPFDEGTYRNIKYVTKEIASLTKQLKKLEPNFQVVIKNIKQEIGL
jgi:hypothetical protein